MPRKKFEEAEEERYSPLNADLRRDAAAVGRNPRPTPAPEPPAAASSAPSATAEPPAAPPVSPREEKVLELPRPAPRKPAARPKPEPRAASQATEKEAPARRGRTSDGPTKRVRINSEEDRAVARFLGRLYEDTGTKVYLSQLARAGWALALRAEDEIRDELAKHPLPSLPSTQDSVAYADYEERLLTLLHRAIRKAKLS